ncbi:MAG: ATP synthase subunit I [Rhodanobacteraceae bacterium]
MSGIHWSAFGWGALAGAVAGALFFAGLAFSVWLALRRRKPLPVLALSALLRIAGLLAVGWLVVKAGGLTALAGYALAFLAARLMAVVLARPAAQRRDTPWN